LDVKKAPKRNCRQTSVEDNLEVGPGGTQTEKKAGSVIYAKKIE
jgi:hypothetical protein